MSDPNSTGVLAQTVPDAITDLASGSLTAEDQIHLTWSPITTSPENGGTAVTAYKIEWD